MFGSVSWMFVSWFGSSRHQQWISNEVSDGFNLFLFIVEHSMKYEKDIMPIR